MGRLDNKVALITGAARGQGRSHAIRLAQEGADIIAVDLCEQVGSVGYPMSTRADLDETVRAVEALDRRIVASPADVRDFDALQAAVDHGVTELGRLDIVSANAGIFTFGLLDELSEVTWQDMIDINLTGVWHTAKAAIPHVKAGGRGGSIVLTSSALGLKGRQHAGHYAAAKHGVLGLMRSLALELAPDMIRVNSIHPGSIRTPMIDNESVYGLLRPDLEHPTGADVDSIYQADNALPVALLEPVDISNALLFLVSDEARYITGVPLPVDAGWMLK